MSLRKKVVDLARRLPDPKSDYLGLSGRLPGLPFQILLFSREPRTDVRPDFHYRFLWIVALNGEGDVIIDNESYRLRAGERVLVKPFSRHSYKRVVDRPPLECLFIGFEMQTTDALVDLHARVQRIDDDDWVCVETLLRSYMSTIRQNAGAGDSLSRNRGTFVANLALWLELAMTDIESERDSLRQLTISPAQQIVERVWRLAREASPAPVEDGDGNKFLPTGESAAAMTRQFLAKKLAVSESSLRDAVNMFAHVSPREFVRRVRLQRAGMWLLEHGFPVHEVAKNAGYGEAAAFSTEFKKLMGTRPSALLKKYHEHVAGHPANRPHTSQLPI